MCKRKEQTIAEIKRELSPEELDKVVGGYPDGDFPAGVNICPRCGGSDLSLTHEATIDTFGSQVIDSIVTDKAIKVYVCQTCQCCFYRYGPFYEFYN